MVTASSLAKFMNGLQRWCSSLLAQRIFSGVGKALCFPCLTLFLCLPFPSPLSHSPFFCLLSPPLR